ncbi:hypothetical protein ZEAMMB73_Zm00001d024035 [Zea mays]|uniref:Mind bomb SH3 repeat domain-containing protein n=1 Tax=Zea mays TaxID=4577 RepID=A0A1D6IXC3_MAIZE|nr:hypothetical protein ZEAMMB73_Zm00001d024035 [Zea mays]
MGACHEMYPLAFTPPVPPEESPAVGSPTWSSRRSASPNATCRYAWGGETHHSVGKIIDIESDGLLTIDIPNWATPWQADPSDMEKIENSNVSNWIRVKAIVPSPKYGWENVTRNSIVIVHSL